MRVLFWFLMVIAVGMFVAAFPLGLLEPGQHVGSGGDRTPYAAIVLLATAGATFAVSFAGIALWMLPVMRQLARVRRHNPHADAIVALTTNVTKAALKDLAVDRAISGYVVVAWDRTRIAIWGAHGASPLLTIQRSDLESIEVGEGWVSRSVPTMELRVRTYSAIVRLPLIPSRDGWELFSHLDPAKTREIIDRILRAT